VWLIHPSAWTCTLTKKSARRGRNPTRQSHRSAGRHTKCRQCRLTHASPSIIVDVWTDLEVRKCRDRRIRGKV
jgi:hypothetical protein